MLKISHEARRAELAVAIGWALFSSLEISGRFSVAKNLDAITTPSVRDADVAEDRDKRAFDIFNFR